MTCATMGSGKHLVCELKNTKVLIAVYILKRLKT